MRLEDVRLEDVAREHVETALDEIDRDRVPRHRRSTGYCLQERGQDYPPKYTLALAHKALTGQEPGPDQYSGGRYTNDILENLGYRVVPCKCGNAALVRDSN
jgi:hypothetical protein